MIGIYKENAQNQPRVELITKNDTFGEIYEHAVDCKLIPIGYSLKFYEAINELKNCILPIPLGEEVDDTDYKKEYSELTIKVLNVLDILGLKNI